MSFLNTLHDLDILTGVGQTRMHGGWILSLIPSGSGHSWAALCTKIHLLTRSDKPSDKIGGHPILGVGNWESILTSCVSSSMNRIARVLARSFTVYFNKFRNVPSLRLGHRDVCPRLLRGCGPVPVKPIRFFSAPLDMEVSKVIGVPLRFI
jgi:hypothetical protein